MPAFIPTKWSWTKQREKAAWMVAEDDLTEHQIAAECGVSRQTIQAWIRSSEFQSRVDEHCKAILNALRKTGIGNITSRVKRQGKTWRGLQRVIDQRAEAGFEEDVPGADTGLIVRQDKVIGTGPSAQRISEYVVDTGTLSELRALEKHAATELGQWTEKLDINHLDDERIIALLEAASATGSEAQGTSGQSWQSNGEVPIKIIVEYRQDDSTTDSSQRTEADTGRSAEI